MSSPSTIRANYERFPVRFLVPGVVGLGALAMAGAAHTEISFRSYLLAFAFWFMIPMGCMGVLMLHHLVGGWWGLPIRRLAEAGTRTLPLMAILFVPVILGMKYLYPWIYNPGDLITDANFKFKMEYLTPHFFIARFVIYFAIWIGIALLLNSWSRQQDQPGADGTKFAMRLEGLSGPGFILWASALSFAVIDWIMSLEPHWFSTIYGMLFMVISGLTAICFMVTVLRVLSDVEPIKDSVTPVQYNDLGNLMLAMTMLWAYMSFSQFLIIWAGNIKDEIPWYMSRAFGGWGDIALFLVVMHFAVPFLLLLQRGVKRRLRYLSIVAGLLLCLSAVDIFWLVMPAYDSDMVLNFRTSGPQLHFTDLLAFIGIGGIWLAAYFWQLKKMPLMPLNDPRFEGALVHEHGD